MATTDTTEAKGLLRRAGRFAVSHRRPILYVSVVVFFVAGAAGAGVAQHLSTGGFDDPDSESTRASEIVEGIFGVEEPDIVLLVTSATGSVDDPQVARAGAALTEELGAEKGVAEVFSYWSLGSLPPLRSHDGSQALVLGRIPGTQNEVNQVLDELTPEYTRTDKHVAIEVGGFGEVFRQVTHQIESDLVRTEMIIFPISFILLLFVFRSPIAALLPVAVGGLSIVGTLVILRLVASVTEVSIFAMNLTTGMGLGLGIDYSLFIVSRFREEMAAGHTSDEATRIAVETAGRTVVFSALAVGASLSALLVFPIVFLRSFAYAGIPTAVFCALGSVLTLPALLATLGKNVDKWTVGKRKPTEIGTGFWHRVALMVMRRPLPIALAVVAFLLILGAPFLRARFGLPDDRVLPRSASARVVHDKIRANFSGNEAFALSIVATDVGNPAAQLRQIDGYASKLSELEGVARVDSMAGSYSGGSRLFFDESLARRFGTDDAVRFSVVLDPGLDAYGPRAERIVDIIRTGPAPFDIQVTGASARLVDGKEAVFARVPLALTIMMVVTLITLFMLFGSVLVPIKAIVLNLLSLTATFGAMVWIFQDGNLSGLLDFTSTGSLIMANAILMFCIAFGLSMDYEVFLLSRIKEEYDKTGDNTHSVAMGLERTGRIVTAAALLLAAVFLAFATSGVSVIKMFGLGLALAIVMDATLVRAALVPAFMRIMGRANWWAPEPLRRLHARYALSG